MLALSHETTVEMRPVTDLLMSLLTASPAFRWPGTDGMLLNDVLTCYRSMAAGGFVPGEAALCTQFPELAARITAFFVLTHELPPPAEA